MLEIKDTGKVWIRGKPGTTFAVKVDDKVFVPGQEEGQSIEYWLEGKFLCVDLHDTDQASESPGDCPSAWKPLTRQPCSTGSTKPNMPM